MTKCKEAITVSLLCLSFMFAIKTSVCGAWLCLTSRCRKSFRPKKKWRSEQFNEEILTVSLPVCLSYSLVYFFPWLLDSASLQSNRLSQSISSFYSELTSVQASCRSKHLCWTNLNRAVFMLVSLYNHSPHFVTSRQNTSIIRPHVNIEQFKF